MSTTDAAQVSHELFAALEHEPRVNLRTDRIELALDQGVATLSGEVADIAAKRLVLEKDRLVDASRIRARCKNAVITLQGFVASDAEKALVEFDAWALFGVDRVVDDMEVVTG